MSLKPVISHVQIQHALALPDGRTPVVISVDGWGLADVGGTRCGFRGPTTWRALVPAGSELKVRLRSLFGEVSRTVPVPAIARGPVAQRVPAVALAATLHGARFHADLRLPTVPLFVFHQEPSDE